MENYEKLSMETHLFFARIMKEHALFLEAGFQCKDRRWIQKAAWFRKQFEDFLGEVVRESNGKIQNDIIASKELVTQFTVPAERITSRLTGASIDSRISQLEENLKAGCNGHVNCQTIRRWNERVVALLNGLIEFKENILREVKSCHLFTANYPLLIEHIIREAKLYRSTIKELEKNRNCEQIHLPVKENFWNQIMMEHALFIRGLLDPNQMELVQTANDFAVDYEQLLETAKSQDCKAEEMLAEKSLKETRKYRQFKEAGTKGIVECKIESIIIPLLADHVLREANHYIRLLESQQEKSWDNIHETKGKC